jgi:hypothetical protein
VDLGVYSETVNQLIQINQPKYKQNSQIRNFKEIEQALLATLDDEMVIY